MKKKKNPSAIFISHKCDIVMTILAPKVFSKVSVFSALFDSNKWSHNEHWNSRNRIIWSVQKSIFFVLISNGTNFWCATFYLILNLNVFFYIGKTCWLHVNGFNLDKSNRFIGRNWVSSHQLTHHLIFTLCWCRIAISHVISLSWNSFWYPITKCHNLMG